MKVASRLSRKSVFTVSLECLKVTASTSTWVLCSLILAIPSAGFAETTPIKNGFLSPNAAEKISAERILCLNKRGEPWKVGTASKINKTTRLTAYHVVKDCSVIYIGNKAYKVSHIDSSIDLAILGYGRDFRDLNCEALPKNNTVTLIGFPEGSKQKIVSQGVTKRDKKSKFSAVEGFAMKGMSGGPVIQDDGRLTGLFKSYRGTSRYWYISGPDICNSVASLKGAMFDDRRDFVPVKNHMHKIPTPVPQMSLVAEAGAVKLQKSTSSVKPTLINLNQIAPQAVIRFEGLSDEEKQRFEANLSRKASVEVPKRLVERANKSVTRTESSLEISRTVDIGFKTEKGNLPINSKTSGKDLVVKKTLGVKPQPIAIKAYTENPVRELSNKTSLSSQKSKKDSNLVSIASVAKPATPTTRFDPIQKAILKEDAVPLASIESLQTSRTFDRGLRRSKFQHSGKAKVTKNVLIDKTEIIRSDNFMFRTFLKPLVSIMQTNNLGKFVGHYFGITEIDSEGHVVTRSLSSVDGSILEQGLNLDNDQILQLCETVRRSDS